MGALQARRLRNWCQVHENRIEDPAGALEFIQRAGIATLYGASPEFPSLYQAHMGDPNPPTFRSWDSPSGYVYTWRWELGRPHAAFYGVVVAKKPTWVAFDRLPAVLGALMERRSPEALYRAGEISEDARQVARAFEGTEGVLSTKELRSIAGFEKGKESRAAYLKAVEELDSRLLLAKRFGEESEGEDMRHALVTLQYPDAVEAALAMDPVEALASLLAGVIAHSIYLDPKPLSRHLRIDAPTVAGALDRLVQHGLATRETVRKATLYVTTQKSNE